MKFYTQVMALVCACFSFTMVKAQEITIKNQSTLERLSGVMISTEVPGIVYFVNSSKGTFDLQTIKGDRFTFSLTGYVKLTLNRSEIKDVVYLQEEIFTTNEVVISASRFDQKNKEVAQQVQVLDRKTLAFINQQTSADALAQSGNVFVQKSQLGGGSPVIRGFEASKVLLVVDGVRMNNVTYRAGHLQDVITLDNTMMERIEILFGTGATVYGSDALGGVMHFYTRNPEFGTGEKTLVKANAFVRTSSANSEKTAHIDFNIGGKRFSSLTSITSSDFGDLRQGNVRSPFNLNYWGRPEYVTTINGVDSIVKNDNPNVQVGSGYVQFDLLQKLSFLQKPGVKHTLNFQMSTSSNVPRYDRLTQYRNGAPRFAEWYYGPQDRKLTAYHLDLTNPNKLFDVARITASFQDVKASRNSRGYRKTSLDSQVDEVKVLALNADFKKEVNTTNELRYGLEVVHNDLVSTATSTNIETGGITPFNTRYPDGGTKLTSFAAYATHNWNVNNWLVLTDGLRYSNIHMTATFNDKTFFPFPYNELDNQYSALSGNLGLIANLPHAWKISLLGSTGFRAPNIDDMGKLFESTGATRDENGNLVELGTLIVPNPDLKPEFTYNADLGVSKTYTESVTFSANAYYTLYRNALTTAATTYDGQSIVQYNGDSALVSHMVNAVEAYIYGFSAQFDARFTDVFGMSSSVNYTYGRVKSEPKDEPLDHIPPVFGRTGLYIQGKQFKGEFYVMYNGWKRLEDYRLNAEDNEANATAVGMPSWYTLNVRTSSQITSNVQVQLALENILDHNYRLFSSNISAPGRNLVVTLSGRF